MKPEFTVLTVMPFWSALSKRIRSHIGKANGRKPVVEAILCEFGAYQDSLATFVNQEQIREVHTGRRIEDTVSVFEMEAKELLGAILTDSEFTVSLLQVANTALEALKPTQTKTLQAVS